jgi:hypothetical protein
MTQADWRGVGREDLIAGNERGDVFHYRNDPPFQLYKLAASITKDTLMAGWQSPFPIKTGSWVEQSLSMSALPKTAGDKSLDWLPYVELDEQRKDEVLRIYRGGEDFGSTRLLIGQPDAIMHAPGYYDEAFEQLGFPNGSLTNCGDMTGTGNNVLFCAGYLENVAFHFFYVMNQGFDDKIDMSFFIEDEIGAFAIDTFSSNGDAKQDVLMGYALKDNRRGWLAQLNGTNRIPVHGKASVGLQSPNTPFLIYPNPAVDRTTFSFAQAMDCNTAVVSIFNTLGQLVLSEQCKVRSGVQRVDVELAGLESGAYMAQLATCEGVYRSHLIVYH